MNDEQNEMYLTFFGAYLQGVVCGGLEKLGFKKGHLAGRCGSVFHSFIFSSSQSLSVALDTANPSYYTSPQTHRKHIALLTASKSKQL